MRLSRVKDPKESAAVCGSHANSSAPLFWPPRHQQHPRGASLCSLNDERGEMHRAKSAPEETRLHINELENLKQSTT